MTKLLIMVRGQFHVFVKCWLHPQKLELWRFIAFSEINKRNAWFQQDGAQTHTAGSTLNPCYKSFLEIESSQKVCGLHEAVV